MQSPNHWIFFILPALSFLIHGSDVSDVCASIGKTISSASKVYYPASTQYIADNHHYMSSSSQISTCVVEVGSTNDTSQAIKIIGAKRTPFAVIAGGHASNQGFSSTTGVLISLVRLKTFQPTAYNSAVVLGTGNVWVNDVYPKMDQIGHNIVGGRVNGPAVGGFTLGGGFSWLTNQHGLTCDTVQSYTLVLPNGTVSEVDSRQPDLFFALKGGLNRFGIVTQIKFKIYPEVPKIYGGYRTILPTSTEALVNATAAFSATNTDPKAQVILTINYLEGIPTPIIIIFYDGPTPSSSLAPFSQLPASFSQVSQQPFSSFAKSIPSQTSSNTRGAFHSLSTKGLTAGFIQACVNETKFYGDLAALHTGVFFSYDIEPFLKTYGQKATDSAFPHSGSPLPLNLYFTWTSPTEDAFWRQKIQQSVDTLTAVAKREGIYDENLPTYPNYALSTYGGDKLYGSANAARLRKIKAAVDPNGIMDLTGGFTI